MNDIQNWRNIHFKDFHQLKQKAYKVACFYNKHGYKEESIKSYINQFAPSSDIWRYRDAIEIYILFIQGVLHRHEAQQKMKKIETEFNKSEELIKHLFSFQLVMDKAFKELKHEYGEVTFECPLCKGEAYGVRFSTPNNIVHKVTFRSGCRSCGHKIMN